MFFFFKLVECAHSQNVSNSLRSRKISFPEATFDLDLTQTAQEYIMAQYDVQSLLNCEWWDYNP